MFEKISKLFSVLNSWQWSLTLSLESNMSSGTFLFSPSPLEIWRKHMHCSCSRSWNEILLFIRHKCSPTKAPSLLKNVIMHMRTPFDAQRYSPLYTSDKGGLWNFGSQQPCISLFLHILTRKKSPQESQAHIETLTQLVRSKVPWFSCSCKLSCGLLLQ